jgi:hypothetical protein
MQSLKKPKVGAVTYLDDDAGRPDKKIEGFSNLKAAHDREQKKAKKQAGEKDAESLHEKLISCLQKQISVMEIEIRLLKDREVDQKNKASGYETLLRDKIPLNEHFLALKTKYNNEKGLLDKNIEAMQEGIKREEHKNKEKQTKIKVLKQSQKETTDKTEKERDALVTNIRKK